MIERLRTVLQARRNLLLLLVALSCGGIAVLAGQRYLGARLEAERRRLAPKPVRMVEVVVARRDLAKGDPVTADTMAVRSIPADYVPSAAIRPDRFDEVVGGRLALSLRSGDPLLGAAIVGGEQAVFSSRLRPGIRALTIAVDEVNSISGMLQPGDRIDLLFSARPPGPGQGATPPTETTIPLFQNLLVLATGRQVRAGLDERPGSRPYSTVTVEVAPEHAQRLVVAQRAGKLTAVLRNPDDTARTAGQALDIRQLLDMAPPPPPPKARPSWRGPQLIVGGRGSSAATPGAASPVRSDRS